MMKVLFVSDFASDKPGGAQLSNRKIIEKGRDLGFDITELNINSSRLPLSFQYDVVITSNFDWFLKEPDINFIFDKITEHSCHVRYEHDSCTYFAPQIRKKFMESVKLNLFLSDFHLQFFQNDYGDLYQNNAIVYDPIDTEIFKTKDVEKEYDYIYCGYVHPLKGFLNYARLVEQNPDKKFCLIGWSDDSSHDHFRHHNFNLQKFLETNKNLTLLNYQTQEKVAEYFQKSKKIFHKPMVNEPFCRMVAEALLCGCEFEGNKNTIGSYLEYNKHGAEAFKEGCKNAADLFWAQIKENL